MASETETRGNRFGPRCKNCLHSSDGLWEQKGLDSWGKYVGNRHRIPLKQRQKRPSYHQKRHQDHARGAPTEVPRTRSAKTQSRVRKSTTNCDPFCAVKSNNAPKQINTLIFWLPMAASRRPKIVLGGSKTSCEFMVWIWSGIRRF